MSAGEYRRADDSGESRIDQNLPAYDDEAAIKFGIVSRTIVRRTAGLMNAIDFASSHLLISNFTSAAGYASGS